MEKLNILIALGVTYRDGGYFGTDYDFGGETITFWIWSDIQTDSLRNIEQKRKKMFQD